MRYHDTNKEIFYYSFQFCVAAKIFFAILLRWLTLLLLLLPFTDCCHSQTAAIQKLLLPLLLPTPNSCRLLWPQATLEMAVFYSEYFKDNLQFSRISDYIKLKNLMKLLLQYNKKISICDISFMYAA